MKQILTAITLATVLLGCSTKPGEDKLTSLETEVLAVHDEIMPKMDSIMILKSILSTKIKEIDSLDNVGLSSNTLAEQRIKAIDINQKLNESDKLMMDWMHAYKGDSAKQLPPEQAVLYFEGERDRILQVKQLTLRSLKEAKTFLE
ncbi:viral A-type inclusion protein [Dyadobacter aurulentus]|uniref:viral A-type inclusion protein n=1 Tax=Dyadobacter sp. UC 10 TaxID=2605428 RepID=UPI0011F1D557|nr:viral A-type inclusion protein [Dyadobacter sp. UC 10]KAA0989290.1 viral A-type inclusion protein [Dyadobacter sp. UC 10]